MSILQSQRMTDLAGEPSWRPGPSPRGMRRGRWRRPAPDPPGRRPRPPAASTRTGRAVGLHFTSACALEAATTRAPTHTDRGAQQRPSCAKGPSGPAGPRGGGPQGGGPGSREGARVALWSRGVRDGGAPPAAASEPPHVGPHRLAALVPDWPQHSQSEGTVGSGSADWPQPGPREGAGLPFVLCSWAPRAPPPEPAAGSGPPGARGWPLGPAFSHLPSALALGGRPTRLSAPALAPDPCSLRLRGLCGGRAVEAPAPHQPMGGGKAHPPEGHGGARRGWVRILLTCVGCRWGLCPGWGARGASAWPGPRSTPSLLSPLLGGPSGWRVVATGTRALGRTEGSGLASLPAPQLAPLPPPLPEALPSELRPHTPSQCCPDGDTRLGPEVPSRLVPRLSSFPATRWPPRRHPNKATQTGASDPRDLEPPASADGEGAGGEGAGGEGAEGEGEPGHWLEDSSWTKSSPRSQPSLGSVKTSSLSESLVSDRHSASSTWSPWSGPSAMGGARAPAGSLARPPGVRGSLQWPWKGSQPQVLGRCLLAPWGWGAGGGHLQSVLLLDKLNQLNRPHRGGWEPSEQEGGGEQSQGGVSPGGFRVKRHRTHPSPCCWGQGPPVLTALREGGVAVGTLWGWSHAPLATETLFFQDAGTQAPGPGLPDTSLLSKAFCRSHRSQGKPGGSTQETRLPRQRGRKEVRARALVTTWGGSLPRPTRDAGPAALGPRGPGAATSEGPSSRRTGGCCRVSGSPARLPAQPPPWPGTR